MKNVLIIGSTGQIGSELTMKLRGIYTNGNIVAGYIKGAEPKGVLAESGIISATGVSRLSITGTLRRMLLSKVV